MRNSRFGCDAFLGISISAVLDSTIILVSLLKPNRFIFTGHIHKIIVRSMIVLNQGDSDSRDEHHY
jgi:hypothetical protein